MNATCVTSALAAIGLLLMAGPGLADEPVIVPLPLKAMPDAPRVMDGRNTDLLGIHLGVSPETVDTALVALGYARRKDERSFQSADAEINDTIRSFLSEPYLANRRYAKHADGADDSIFVAFTLPTSGQKAYFIARTITYDDLQHQPPIASIDAAALAKYGPANKPDPAHLLPGACWTFVNDARYDTRSCPQYGREFGFAEPDVDFVMGVYSTRSGPSNHASQIYSYVADLRAGRAISEEWKTLSAAAVASTRAAEQRPETAAPKL